MKRAIILCLSMLMLFLAVSCGKDASDISNTTLDAAQAPTTAQSAPTQTPSPSQNDFSVTEEPERLDNTDALIDTKQETTTEELTLPTSNGTMQFTDSANNKFIQAVHKQYQVDTDLLVAIYKEPADDSNCVWQFNGAKTADGKIIRSADTLQYVYIISADTKTICRTDGKDDNIGMTAKEGYFTFKTTKNIIMPRFTDQLNGN